jgi:hypothetical protein
MKNGYKIICVITARLGLSLRFVDMLIIGDQGSSGNKKL